jgi:hypothetical protein
MTSGMMDMKNTRHHERRRRGMAGLPVAGAGWFMSAFWFMAFHKEMGIRSE